MGTYGLSTQVVICIRGFAANLGMKISFPVLVANLPHEVLLGLDVVADLEDDPAAALGLEVAVDPPRPLRQVRRVDEVDARLAGALRRLDVVARETHVVRP